MKPSNVVFLVFAFVLVTAFYVYKLIQRAPVIPPFRISLPAYEGTALVRLADRLGYFTEEGLDVTIDESNRRTEDALALLIDGSVDMAVIGEAPIAMGRAPAGVVRLVATIYWSDKDMKIVARKDHGIASPSDLRGKRVAATRASARDFCLSNFLKHNQIEESEVVFLGGEPAALIKDLKSGKLDAAAFREPDAFNLRRQGRDKFIIFSEPGLCKTSLSLLTRFDFVNEFPAVVEKTLRALIRAEDFWNRYDEYSISVISEDLGLQPAFLQQARKEARFGVFLDPKIVASLEDKAKWMIRQGMSGLTQIPDFRALVHDKPLRNVESRRVSF